MSDVMLGSDGMLKVQEEPSIWDRLIEVKDMFIEKFELEGWEEDEPGMERFNQPENGWVNRVWESPYFRRAHVDVVDARDTKGLWMMHVCIFPTLHSDAPIFGFDVIAGKNKMTGAFHDFSPSVNEEHYMIKHFSDVAKSLNWKREREMPDWGKAIFSEDIIAAGNVREKEEIDQLVYVVETNLDYYLMELMKYSGNASDDLVIKAHNRYAHFQKQNPHTPRVMKSLGLSEDDVEMFIEDCLFPEIPEIEPAVAH
jgi:phycocyanobilin:ferredoxin oxidoreductase